MHTWKRWGAFAALLTLLTLTAAAPSLAQKPAASPQAALTALIAAPDSPLPAGTRLYSVHVADGLATADFSRQLRDNFHGGDTEEANAVNGILRALGASPEIRRVQILVAGQSVDSLGGVIDISEPLAVIRPTGFADAQKRYFHRHKTANH